jgi:DNA-binding MarR family transcriptional regulator
MSAPRQFSNWELRLNFHARSLHPDRIFDETLLVHIFDYLYFGLYHRRMHGIRSPRQQMGLPALLRGARNTYRAAISEPLAAAGFDDVPRNGVFVIGAISRTGAPLSEVIQWLGVSKQSAGQLVDALVARGYVERSVDEEDRRRLTVQLTSRGRAVAAIARAAVDRIDKRLHERVGNTHLAHTRSTLLALIDLGADTRS